MTDNKFSQPKFCSQCGAALQLRWIESDQRNRLCCTSCEVTHYQNPKILVVAMITCGTQLLLCQRAHKPSAGLWTPPSGFMEENETLEQATARETLEETGVKVNPDKLLLHTIVNLPSISEVYLTFRATVGSTEVGRGPESLDVAFLDEQDVPWNALAYPAMYGFLKMFFQELKDCKFDMHLSHVDRTGKSRRKYILKSIEEKEYSTGPGRTMLDE